MTYQTIQKGSFAGALSSRRGWSIRALMRVVAGAVVLLSVGISIGVWIGRSGSRVPTPPAEAAKKNVATPSIEENMKALEKYYRTIPEKIAKTKQQAKALQDKVGREDPELTTLFDDIKQKRDLLYKMYDELPEVVSRTEKMVEIHGERVKVMRERDKVKAAVAMNALRKKGVPGPVYEQYSDEELTELEKKVNTLMDDMVRLQREKNEIKTAAREKNPVIKKLTDEIIEKQYFLRAKLDALPEVRSLRKEEARLVEESKRVSDQMGALKEKSGGRGTERKTVPDAMGKDEGGRFNG